MSDWKTYRLGNFIDINQCSINKDFEYDTIEYLDTSSVTENRFSGIQKLKIEDAPSRAKRIVKNNDIVYSTVRPILRHYGIVKNPKPNTIASTGFAVLSAKNIDPDFLFYYLTTDEIVFYLNSVAEANTTTFPAFNAPLFDNIEITIPVNIKDQCKIAKILSSLDDKIELNLQMNITLEAMAQAIFKEWFVDFHFPGADGMLVDGLPKGWKKGRLGEITFIQNGYAFKSDDFSNEGENGILKIKNISNNVVDIINMQYIPNVVAENIDSRFKVKSGDLLIAMTGAEVGKVGIVPNTDKELWLNQRVGSFREKTKYSKWFSYLILSTPEYQNVLLSTASGSAQPNISASQIENVEIILPNNEIIEQFGNIINSLFERIIENYSHNQTLTQVRNNLLPRLMSGKIEIKEIFSNFAKT
ncbi:type I restriction-modification system, specificity subunit S [Candidatus Symbiothrix dinenymphae]|nr:type I restriction-modification system, specificity subunit S [Candidatus Symbiothrix dinenymphae]